MGKKGSIKLCPTFMSKPGEKGKEFSKIYRKLCLFGQWVMRKWQMFYSFMICSEISKDNSLSILSLFKFAFALWSNLLITLFKSNLLWWYFTQLFTIIIIIIIQLCIIIKKLVWVMTLVSFQGNVVWYAVANQHKNKVFTAIIFK